MKKILFPFEINIPIYSNAFICAAKFARNFRAELIMLNVFSLKVDDSITKAELSNLIRKNWLKAYKEIYRLKSLYLTNYARIDNQLKIKFDYRVLHGHFLKEIQNILSTEEIDLLVLPIPDRMDANKKLEELIQTEAFEKNNASVVLVPSATSYKPIQKIAFATDFKKLAQHEIILKQIISVARVFHAQIHFLHLSQAEKDHLPEESDIHSALMELTSSSQHIFRNICGRDIGTKLLEYVETNRAELLALTRHQQRFPETLFHRMHGDEIALKSRVPVMILKELD